jgi:hypothetical protein
MDHITSALDGLALPGGISVLAENKLKTIMFLKEEKEESRERICLISLSTHGISSISEDKNE